MTKEITPEEMLKYATKFEFPQIKVAMKLRIEKSTYLDGDYWLIRNINNEVFDRTKGELGFIRIAKDTPNYYYSSLEEAFHNVEYLTRKEKEDDVFYKDKCRRCKKIVQEKDFKEIWGMRVCPDCYDIIDAMD